jgi:hypothetical protein
MTESPVRATIDGQHQEERTMTESTDGTPADEPKADETFTWTNEGPSGDAAKSGTGSTATSILDSVRDVVDELAERAAPTVREFSARAAELTAIAADKAAPFAKRAGEVTADASGKLATRSREWASELRASVATAERDAGAGSGAHPETSAGTPSEPGQGDPETTDQPGPN